MANVLIIAEHSGGKLKKVTLSAITFGQQAAKLLGGDLHILALGESIHALGDELAKYGAKAVHLADAPVLKNYLAEPYARVAAEVAKSVGAEIVASVASFTGKDLLPRVAARLGAGALSDVIGVSKEGGELRFVHPIYAGNAYATSVIDTPVKVVSVRPTAFDTAQPAGGPSPIQKVSVVIDAAALKTSFLKFEATQSTRPELADARVVVAGGRGLKGPENFKIVEELADTLGGAVGATRAIVDAGWVPNDLQIGQTGKVVAPQLYFAVGLSGAIQHLAGMKDSKVIVAINKDPEAPIFKVADYGLVDDLFKAVPELVAEIKKLQAS
jgi:electron transfer flavoprotein alpha subunit